MIINHQPYGFEVNLRCSVKDSLGAWVEVLGDSTSVSVVRGGSTGVAGLASVEVGTMAISILDLYDPSQTALLAPNVDIILYTDTSDTPDPTNSTANTIFTGNIQDIATDYFYEAGGQHVNVVVYSVDAVSSHSGITISNSDGQPGFTGTTFNGVANTANGYQRWEDRINDLSTGFAKKTVPAVIINGPIPIYSI